MRHATPLLVLSAALVLSSCGLSTVSQKRRMTLAHVPGSAIEVESRNGSVTIRRVSGGDVAIEAEIRAVDEQRLDEAEIIATRKEDGTLYLTARWPGGRKSNEGCSYVIDLPDVGDVRVKNGNGRIEVEGSQGTLALHTSNGKIKVRRHSGGPIEARTSNGKIDLSGALSRVHARSSNGRIEVDGCTGPIDLETSNGKIEVRLAPGFTGSIAMQTSNGRCKVKREDGVTEKSIHKRSGTVTFGQGPPSRLKTSNGSIEIE